MGGYEISNRLHCTPSLALTDLCTGYTKKSINASFVFLGYCLGNFLGPLLFHEKDAPRYAPGFTAVTATAISTAVLAMVYRYVAMWGNKRRDKSGVAESYEHAYDDDLTDIKVSDLDLSSIY